MYFETISTSKAAELREEQIKKYRREKKIALFVESNPTWRDLVPEIFESVGVARYDRGVWGSLESIQDSRDPSLRSGLQKKATLGTKDAKTETP